MDKEQLEKIENKIISWLKEQLKKSKTYGFVVGLSGGIDSSVTAVLCKKAGKTLGIIMPCSSNTKDAEDAKTIAEKFGIDFKEINLHNVFESFLKVFNEQKKEEKLEIANIKPRLRMTTLYYFANKLNYLVVGTDNKSEETIGYFTKYGDGGVDILPIAGLLKKEVKELAKHLGIPDSIITKKPTAGLWQGQTDEGEMGITYDQLDNTLEKIKNKKEKEISPETLKKVKSMIKNSEHKRKMPPICKLKIQR